uniref:S-formylglutathione hydrolase n=1 Tax=Setaria digitata TaxID=48799 RepID=A0A915Q1A9_9BILA
MVVVNADTSPRAIDIPGDFDYSDFGKDLFYRLLERMHTYITEELPHVIRSNFAECDPHRWGKMGHSMGGHGAIVIGLRNPGVFLSISAFAPICNPINCNFLALSESCISWLSGSVRREWKAYDSVEVINWRDLWIHIPLWFLFALSLKDKNGAVGENLQFFNVTL